ncbi:MAG: hypothetical protein MJ196_06050 [Treponemataceae bacterium]|nr:hypothetical protein [Treponemataceae bacterium]
MNNRYFLLKKRVRTRFFKRIKQPFLLLFPKEALENKLRKLTIAQQYALLELVEMRITGFSTKEK